MGFHGGAVEAFAAEAKSFKCSDGRDIVRIDIREYPARVFSLEDPVNCFAEALMREPASARRWNDHAPGLENAVAARDQGDAPETGAVRFFD